MVKDHLQTQVTARYVSTRKRERQGYIVGLDHYEVIGIKRGQSYLSSVTHKTTEDTG